MSFQLKLYKTVIEDVIHNVTDSFLDEGVDDQVLQELKQIWTTKMMASKAVEPDKERVDVPPPNVAKVSVSIITGLDPFNSPRLMILFQSGVLNKTGNKNVVSNGAKSKAPQRTAAETNGNTSQTTTTTPAAASASSSSTAPPAASGSGTTAANPAQNNMVQVLDPFKLIPIQITLPPQGDAESRVLTIQLPGSVIQNNQLGQMLTASVIQSIMNLPPSLASSVLQQHVNTTLQNNAMQSEWSGLID